MRRASPIGHVCRLAGVLLLGTASPVHGATWFALDALSAASGLAIEVDTDSLRQNASRRDVTVRVTYPAARQHRWGPLYRSVVMTVEFRCEGGLGSYRDATYYSDVKGTGLVTVREEGPSQIPERIRELLPPRSLETLTRAACAQPTPAAR
jgi:hypothetical protein